MGQQHMSFDALEQKYGVGPKKWRCVYPCYLNVKYTIAQGRKIAKKYCVTGPHPSDIGEVCKYLGLPFYIELNKRHPRDFFVRSRVRVLLKKEDGVTNRREDIPNRHSLLIAIGKMIPRLESRKLRLQRQKQIIAQRKGKYEEHKRGIQEKEEKIQQKREEKKKKKNKKGGYGNKRSKGTKGRRGKG